MALSSLRRSPSFYTVLWLVGSQAICRVPKCCSCTSTRVGSYNKSCCPILSEEWEVCIPLARITHLLLASGLFSYLKTKEVFDFLYYICGIVSKKTGVQPWILRIYGRVESCFIKVNCKYPVGVAWTLQGWVSVMLCFINKSFETSVGSRKNVLILPSKKGELFS